MDFTVVTDSLGTSTRFSGSSLYRFESGLLVVHTDDQKITFGPAGWQRIEEPASDDGSQRVR